MLSYVCDATGKSMRPLIAQYRGYQTGSKLGRRLAIVSHNIPVPTSYDVVCRRWYLRPGRLIGFGHPRRQRPICPFLRILFARS